MGYTTLATVNWGTDPAVPVTISYDSQRSGTSMRYCIRVSLAPMTGGNSFPYPVYLGLTLDDSAEVSGYAVKAASPGQWSSAIIYDSGWVNVSGKTGGTTALTVRLYSGGGSSRDAVYSYDLPVSEYQGTAETGEGGSSGGSALVEWLRPSVSLAASVVNDNAVVAGWGICVQGLSKLQYTITAQAHLFAVIRSYTFSFAGQKLSDMAGTTGVIGMAGSMAPTATVTDSNGLRTTVSGEAIEVYPYNAPRIRSSFAWRCDSQGNEVDGGTYLRVLCEAECSDLDGRNNLTVRVRYRPAGGTYGSYVSLQNGVETTIGGGLGSHTSYEVEISAVDTVGQERTIRYVAPTAAVAFHLRSGGNGAAFGKYAEQDGLECAWNARFLGNAAVSGELSAQTVRVGNKSLLDWIYPIGAIYISTAAANPATLFGGTWQSIQGRFLLAAGGEYAALSTGGAASHTLTEDEMPSHSHDISIDGDGEHSHYIENYARVESWGSGTLESWGSGDGGSRDVYTDSDGYHSHDASASYTGGDASFSLMPPYLAVYMWKRVS